MIWLFFFSLFAHADIEILDSYRIALPKQGAQCEVGSIYAIFSQDGGEKVLAYAEVIGEGAKDRSLETCVARVQSHSQNALVRNKDRAVLMNLNGYNSNLPGRFDLVRKGHRSFAARYKPVTYIGYGYGQTAATLDQGEFLAGVGPLAYGITNELQVDTTPILFLLNIGTAGIKYHFLEIEDMRFSAYLQGLKFFKSDLNSWSAELLLDATSNGHSMTHTKLKFFSKLPETLLLTDKDKKKKYSLELSSVYEWILPSWHRIMLGPKITAGSENELGFFLTSMFIWNTYHLSLSLVVNSIEKLDIKNNKQTYSLDMYWRF